MNIFKKSAILIIFFCSLITFVLYNYMHHENNFKFTKIIIISPKSSIFRIADELIKAQIIQKRYPFIIIAKIYSLKYPFFSGEYEIPDKSSIWQILHILNLGQSIIHKIVVPEGAMVSEILSKINNEFRLVGEDIINITEGSLFPDTYFYIYGDSKINIISQMQNKMKIVLDNASIALQINSIIKNKNELLILASIVEKEAMLISEKSIIASVFINRLRLNMKLQADPTTIYALTQGKYILPRLLTRNDLLIPSSYNTYYTTGLPPTPICCPGKESIFAVVNAPKTKYLYFVANNINGGHNFSSNLNSHINKVNEYRKTISKP